MLGEKATSYQLGISLTLGPPTVGLIGGRMLPDQLRIRGLLEEALDSNLTADRSIPPISGLT